MTHYELEEPPDAEIAFPERVYPEHILIAGIVLAAYLTAVTRLF